MLNPTSGVGTSNAWAIVWPAQEEGQRASTFARGIERARQLVPADHVVAVVLEQDQPWWADAVIGVEAHNVVQQPIQRGTGVGILLALLRILDRDPAARVVLVAADGVLSEGPGRNVPSLGFVTQVAEEGATLGAPAEVVAVPARVLALYRQRQPELYQVFIDLPKSALFDAGALEGLYPFLPEVDFVAGVLHPAPEVVLGIAVA